MRSFQSHRLRAMSAGSPPPLDPELRHLQRYLDALVWADWNDPAGPIQLARDLPLSAVAGSPHFHNTRTLLRAVDDAGGAPTTATGNLNRAFVQRVWGQLALSAFERQVTERSSRRLNELEVWPLHIARTLAECGRMVMRRKRRFVLTSHGRALLPDEQAGALFHRLFYAHFRQMDLRYVAHLRDVPGIQKTLAVTLWRLDQIARDWCAVKGIAGLILPPTTLIQLHAAMVSEYDTEEWIVSAYVLTPLLEFGLLERQKPSEWRLVGPDDAIRLTPLFRRFVSFAPMNPEPPSSSGSKAFAA